MGFPAAVVIVLVLGTSLVAFARSSRDANASPRANEDHFHAAYSIYTCIPVPGTEQPAADDASTPAPPPASDPASDAPASSEPPQTSDAPASDPGGPDADPADLDGSSSRLGGGSALPAVGHLGVAQEPPAASDASEAPPASDSPETTATTAAPDSATTTVPAPESGVAPATTIPGDGEVPGQFLQPLSDDGQDLLGIHTHSDSVIHIHPFADSAAGRKATMARFFEQVGVRMTDDALTLPDGRVFREGTTKCEGDKDGTVQLGKWDSAEAAGRGEKPNQVFTSDFSAVRLGNGEAYTLAFIPEGSTIPVQQGIAAQLEQLGAIDSGTTTTTAESSEAPSSEPPSSDAPPDSSSASTPPDDAPESPGPPEASDASDAPAAPTSDPG
ncbi:MAG: hypothetical protein ACT4PW_10965 [Acidimicrobiia bacterium]